MSKDAVDAMVATVALVSIGGGCAWMWHPGLALIVCGGIVFGLVVGLKLMRSNQRGNTD